MTRRHLALWLFLIFVVAPLCRADAYELELHVAITLAKEATQPRVIGTNVLLTHVPPRPARYVGVVFAHEGFRDLHVFRRNDNGVYVIAVPLPREEVSELVYRLVVDGVWIPDPVAERTTTDEYGNVLSMYPLPPREEDPPTPRITARGVVEFTFPFREGRAVYLAGDFNNWDPFMYRLREVEPGTYAIALRLPAGVHDYYFIADGYRYADPGNPRRSSNDDGRVASRFRVP